MKVQSDGAVARIVAFGMPGQGWFRVCACRGRLVRNRCYHLIFLDHTGKIPGPKTVLNSEKESQ